MDRVRLERTFCWKISGELKLFKYRILQKEKEDIYSLAYRINTIICIYEALMEMCDKLETHMLQMCIEIPGLLTYLYGKWLKDPDSHNKELEYSIMNAICDMQQNVA